MKILFFSSYLATPHYETELELMESHLKMGDEVVQIVCDAVFKTCLNNLGNDKSKCIECVRKRKLGNSLLSKSVNTINIEKYFQNIILPSYPDFKNVKELKKFYVEKFDAGYAVASSIIDLYGKANPNLNEIIDPLILLLNTSLETYYGFKKILEKEKPDLVYVFNGRFAIERSVLRACEACNVRYFTHERGHGKDYYQTFENSLPHNAIRRASLINNYWEMGEFDKVSIAKTFFEERLKRISKSWKSFVSDQIYGKMPNTWDPDKHNIVFFTSSEFERSAISVEWDNDIYDSVSDAVFKINEYFKINPFSKEYKIYLRIHPFTKEYFHEEEELFEKLGYNSNFEIISSKSDICSYSLMQHASKVVTFGSTVGMEATYWGTPSILVGHSFYEEMDCVYNVSSIEEMVRLILNKELQPKSIEGALKYGYYHQTFGIPFKYYQAKSLFSGTFMGKDLNYWNNSFIRYFSPKVVAKKVFSIFQNAFD